MAINVWPQQSIWLKPREQPALARTPTSTAPFDNFRPAPHTSSWFRCATDTQRWLSERAKIAAKYPPVSDEIPAPGEWSAVPWEPTTTQSLIEAHTQSRGIYTVLACLDDNLGVLRDINHEQEQVETRHEKWQADNNLRLSCATPGLSNMQSTYAARMTAHCGNCSTAGAQHLRGG